MTGQMRRAWRKFSGNPNERETKMTNALVYILALTLWHECRGEPWAGKMSVASVIYARAEGRPDRMQAVVFAKKQFSCWNRRSKTRLAAPEIRNSADMRAWQECWTIAECLAAGTFKPCIVANHYHTRQVRPIWARRMVAVKAVGQHVFYRAKAKAA